MKVLVALASAAVAQRGGGENRVQSQKRYFQLTDMMENYNSNFDERKYWAYGCNCLILGDRPMSDPGKTKNFDIISIINFQILLENKLYFQGFGRPVDELDSVCKAYKDCLKCARREFGDMCIGEFVKYDYRIKNGQVKCKSTVRSH